MSANAEKARALRFQADFLDRVGGGLQLSALFAHLPMVAFLAKDERSRFVFANAPTLMPREPPAPEEEAPAEAPADAPAAAEAEADDDRPRTGRGLGRPRRGGGGDGGDGGE